MDLKQKRSPDYHEQRDCIRAIKNQDIEKLAAFINKYGVDASVLNGTCLHQAIFNNNYLAVKFLLDHQANPDALYENNITPLLASIDLNFWDIATLLIQYAADVNLKDGQNNTPLSKAIFHYKGDPLFIKLLLAKKADPHLNLLDGYTAIDLAKSKNLKDILEIIDKNPT